ncbi:hypothetical protein GWK47_017979 [Chionoecetes opilio]|uniref:Uncharacterized protein n=1 Tax=Chionoecetes opilio TaxID=41210 RepID=A0A8J4XTF9_CHIOP|nr:hypothetical protein GWK47_017979 [Chionoecetes opilio]
MFHLEDVLNVYMPLVDEDVVTAKLLMLNNRLGNVSNVLRVTRRSASSGLLPVDIVTKFEPMLAMLSWNLGYAQISLRKLLNLFPSETVLSGRHHIRKRGLFDLGGVILGGVFSLATESDVKNIENTMSQVKETLNDHGRVLFKQNVIIKKLLAHQNIISVKVNDLVNITNQLAYEQSTLLEFVNVGYEIQALQSVIDDLASDVHKFSMFSFKLAGEL